MSGSQLEGNNGSGLPPSNLSVDSISLGQLKNFIGNNQKPKVQHSSHIPLICSMSVSVSSNHGLTLDMTMRTLS